MRNVCVMRAMPIHSTHVLQTHEKQNDHHLFANEVIAFPGGNTDGQTECFYDQCPQRSFAATRTTTTENC